MQNLNVEILVTIILVLLFSALGFFLWRRKGPDQVRITKNSRSKFIAPKRTCPLCGKTLEHGMRVHSTLFPGKEFDLMRIFGCRYCRNDDQAFISAPDPRKLGGSSARQKFPKRLNRRRCPCCNGELPKGGYAMARVYQNPHRLPHVHVYGCTICKPGRG